jgi:hypothetical protein
MEELRAELVLKAPDLLGDGGLSDRELPRRFCEVPLLGDGDEVPQLMELHGP